MLYTKIYLIFNHKHSVLPLIYNHLYKKYPIFLAIKLKSTFDF